jgi:hypothetical protein
MVIRSMEHRLKILGFAFAAAACVVLAATPGVAQESARKAGSDRDTSRGGGAGTGGGAIKSGSDVRGSDASPGGDGGTTTLAAPDKQANEFGTDASRKGTLGTTPGPKGVTLDHGINLISPDDGYAGLRRRAIRKTLIANAAKKPAGLLAGIGATPLFPHPGPVSGTMHNAIGTVVPAGNGVGGSGSGHHAPGFMAHAGIDAIGGRGGATGTSAIGTNITGTGGGAGIHRPTIVSGAVAGPAVHMAGVNGTTMGHIVVGPGSVGGPASVRSGINGTTLRPTH